MGIFDEFKRLAHPYEDEDEDDFEDDFDLSPRPVSHRERERDRSDRSDRDRSSRSDTLYGGSSDDDRRSNKVVNIRAATQLQVVLVKPDKFEDASAIAPTRRSPAACWTSCPAWPMPTRARLKRWPSPPTSSPPTTWTSWAT